MDRSPALLLYDDLKAKVHIALEMPRCFELARAGSIDGRSWDCSLEAWDSQRDARPGAGE